LLLRQKAALLGFPTHADFVLDMRMAKSQKRVAEFLKDLAEKLQPLKKSEMELFLQYKKQDVFLFYYVHFTSFDAFPI
jgi:thimet oligopeptidase